MENDVATWLGSQGGLDLVLVLRPGLGFGRETVSRPGLGVATRCPTCAATRSVLPRRTRCVRGLAQLHVACVSDML